MFHHLFFSTVRLPTWMKRLCAWLNILSLTTVFLFRFFLYFFFSFFSISHSQSDIERSSCIVFLRAASSSFLLPRRASRASVQRNSVGPAWSGAIRPRSMYTPSPAPRERVRDPTGSLPHAASWEWRDNKPRSKKEQSQRRKNKTKTN